MNKTDTDSKKLGALAFDQIYTQLMLPRTVLSTGKPTPSPTICHYYDDFWDHLHLHRLYSEYSKPWPILGTQGWWWDTRKKKTALLGDSCQLMVKDVITDDDTAMVSKWGNRKTVLRCMRCKNSLNKRSPCLTFICTRSTPRQHVNCLVQINRPRYKQKVCYVSDFVGGSSFSPFVSKS